jgi:hypothetical protein
MADEALVLRPNGTVRLELESGRYTLRRPTLREYRLLAEHLRDLAEEHPGSASAAIAQSVDWLREAFGRLGDRPLPGDDGLPSWVSSARIPSELVGHWQTAPKSPWRKIGPGERVGPPRTVLEEVGDLYRSLIEAQINPLEADQMELWQIASLMSDEPQLYDPRQGRQIEGPLPGLSAPAAQPPPAPRQPVDPLLLQRVRAARGEGPEPVAAPTPSGLLSAFGVQPD